MTLKEKFHQWLNTDPFNSKERPTLREAQLERIAEDFSCDFLAWFKNQVFLHCEWSVFDLSEKEILEEFKKEKGL